MTQSSFWQVACHKCWISTNGQREKNLGELERPKIIEFDCYVMADQVDTQDRKYHL